MTSVILKPRRDKSARLRHPWLFSGAIARVDGKPGPGEVIRLLDPNGDFVAYGYFNAASQISVRLLEWNEEAVINDAWWSSRLQEAISRRGPLANDPYTDCYRLVYGESDLLPGLIVDRYADHLVVQILTAGIEKVKQLLLSQLAELTHPAAIYDRSDSDVRELEGLKPASGTIAGLEPPDLITITENGCRFSVDIKKGQKTGFYLDQRNNRQIVATFGRSLDLLDCFSYTGAFSVYALLKGANSATLIDSSAQALALARKNMNLNTLDSKPVNFVEGDVFKALREYRDAKRYFDMVILDPPKFAPSKANLKKALSAYKDINLQAMSLVRPDGYLATFSCSGAVDLQTLQMVLFWAATDARRNVQICRTLSQGVDHPRLVAFPESDYLKGYVCRVL
jgi:23S rRNA (cytosine1962-C5)-methyltransferase